MQYESHRFVATFACGALFPPPQPAKIGDEEIPRLDTIKAYLLHSAAVLSCVIDKTLLELTNVLQGIRQLLLHLLHGRLHSDFLKALESVGKQAR